MATKTSAAYLLGNVDGQGIMRHCQWLQYIYMAHLKVYLCVKYLKKKLIIDNIVTIMKLYAKFLLTLKSVTLKVNDKGSMDSAHEGLLTSEV